MAENSRCSVREICTETGLLATEACPTVTTEIFKPGAEPQEYCNVHVGLPRRPGRPEVPYDSEAPSDEPPGEAETVPGVQASPTPRAPAAAPSTSKPPTTEAKVAPRGPTTI